MKLFAAVAAMVGGALLLVIPRFVFRTCEAIGRGRMHCTDLAHGEYLVGALLVLTGVALIILESNKAAIAAAGCTTVLSVAAFFVPAYTRYCANPEMPCHYGMAPSVRFIAVVLGIVEVTALAGLVRESKRRDA